MRDSQPLEIERPRPSNSGTIVARNRGFRPSSCETLVGGHFTTIGGGAASRIARWNGAWWAFGSL
jgi:hypothetical protein